MARVDPAHFQTSSKQDFKAYPSDVYARNLTPSRTTRNGEHTSPAVRSDPPRSESRNAFGAPPKSAYLHATPVRVQQKTSVARVDPAHFQTSNKQDFKGYQPCESGRSLVRGPESANRKFSTKGATFGAIRSTAHSDFPAHRIEPHRSPAAAAKDHTGDFGIGGLKSEYRSCFTPKTSPPRQRSLAAKGVVHHVDPSHFLTTKELAFKAPPPSHVSVTPSRRVVSVTHMPASHYTSTSRASYGAPV